MSDAAMSAAASVGEKFISSLPAQFLGLCVLNVIFILGLLWFVDRRAGETRELIAPILAECMRQIPADVARQLLQGKGQ
jgi:hypothetical protein